MGYSHSWQFTVIFAVVSLVLVSATGFGLSRYLGHNVRQGEIDNAASDLQSRVTGLIASRLSSEQIIVPLSSTDYGSFDEYVQQEVIREDTLRLDLWHEDGTLLYSSAGASQVGQVSSTDGDLADALRGAAAASVQTIDSQERLVVLAPLVLDDSGGVAAAVEVHEAYAPLAARVQRFETTTYVGIAAAMGFIYAALLIIVERGTHTQRRQRRSLVGRSQEMKRSLDSLLQVLSVALDLRDRVRKGHSLRVARIAQAIGTRAGADRGRAGLSRSGGYAPRTGYCGPTGTNPEEGGASGRR